MSYRKSHIKSKIHKIKPKKSVFKKMWFWLLILFFIIIFVAFYFFLFYPGFQVKNIIISGNDKIIAQDIEKAVLENSVTGLLKFWKINITSQSIFLVNKGNINKEILKRFPMIEKLDINKKFPQTITLGIEERKPIGAFCNNDNRCFLIDGNGIIFDLLPVEPENMTIIKENKQNNEISVSQQVLSNKIIGDIYKIKKDLEENFGINLKEALITSPIRLNAITNEKWKIYFNLDPNYDIDSQIMKLNIALKNEIGLDRKNLQYIDLRPKDRAIICENDICANN